MTLAKVLLSGHWQVEGSGIFSWLIALITLLVLGPTILNCQKETAPDFH